MSLSPYITRTPAPRIPFATDSGLGFNQLITNLQAGGGGGGGGSSQVGQIATGTNYGTAFTCTASTTQFISVPAGAGCILANLTTQLIINAGTQNLLIYVPGNAASIGFIGPGTQSTFLQYPTGTFTGY